MIYQQPSAEDLARAQRLVDDEMRRLHDESLSVELRRELGVAWVGELLDRAGRAGDNQP